MLSLWCHWDCGVCLHGVNDTEVSKKLHNFPTQNDKYLLEIQALFEVHKYIQYTNVKYKLKKNTVNVSVQNINGCQFLQQKNPQ